MTTSQDEHLAAWRPTSRAAQRLIVMRLYRQAKFKGRTPKSWLIRFRKLVERGFLNGYDHIKTGSRTSSSVADTLLSALEPAADLAPVFPDPSYSQRNAASLTGERRAWAA